MTMLKNFKLGIKLMGGFILTASLILAVGVLAFFQQNKILEDLNFISQHSSSALELAQSIESNLNSIDASVNLLLSPYLSADDRRHTVQRIVTGRNKRTKLSESFVANPVAKMVDAEWKAFQQAVVDLTKTNSQIVAYSNELVAMDILSPYRMQRDSERFELEIVRDTLRLTEMLSRRIPYEGNTDPQATQMGKWLADIGTTNPAIRAIADTLRPLHRQFYRLAAQAKDLAARGETTQAAQIIADQLKPLLAEIIKGVASMDEVLEKSERTFRNMTELLLKEGEENMAKTAKTASILADKVNAISAEAVAGAVRDADAGKTVSLICMAAGVFLAVTLGFLLTRTITKPLFLGVDLARSMSDGDMTKQMNVDQRDEIGALAKALNEMAGNLRKMFGDIHSGVGNVDSSSSQLAAISLQMSTNLASAAKRLEQVAAAAEEMSSNQNTIAAAMEQASTNVNMVATSAEEMNATITEIASNSAKAKKITAEAVSHSQKASERVDELGRAADDINKVTEVITEISEQTNLLALNATIEAARAGEVGRGFAVVANEIKDLAKQTAEATLDIKNKIQGIQQATGVTVKEINEISSVIVDVDNIVATIASAVEEQSVTTKEIAENVAQASQGITEVNENVAQSSIASQEIARDIADVSNTANELTGASNQVKVSAEDLKRISDKLNTMIARFKI